MRKDQAANDQAETQEDAPQAIGLSSAMHDMQMLATRYREHQDELTPIPPPPESTAADPRLLLIPTPPVRSDHWKQAAFALMVLLGLTTSALAVTLAFRPSAKTQPAVGPVIATPESKPQLDAATARVEVRAEEPAEQPMVEPVAEEPVAERVKPIKTLEQSVKVAPLRRTPRNKPLKTVSGCDEAACLLGDAEACCDSVAPSDTSDSVDAIAARPYRPSREQVMTSMRSIRGRVSRCFADHGYQGVALVKVIIAPDGSVSKFDMDDGGVGFQACVAPLVSGLEFPQLRQPFTLSYPFTDRH